MVSKEKQLKPLKKALIARYFLNIKLLLIFGPLKQKKDDDYSAVMPAETKRNIKRLFNIN